MENNNELAKEFAVWCWSKEVSSDVSKIESLFSSFLAEKELKEQNEKIFSINDIEKILYDKVLMGNIYHRINVENIIKELKNGNQRV